MSSESATILEDKLMDAVPSSVLSGDVEKPQPSPSEAPQVFVGATAVPPSHVAELLVKPTEAPTMIQADAAPSAPTEVSPAAAACSPGKQRASPLPGASAAPPPSVVAPSATAAAAKAGKSKKKKTQPSVAIATTPTSQSGSQGAQGENTGRWTAEEHRLFLQGLEQHGKGWKKIASLIKSRTVVQIRTHAQKYFQKLAKARQNGEEGDVTMEGRGGTTCVTAVAAAVAHNNKRRRQTTGTKRKAIQSVVGSAQRQGKKMAVAQAAAGVPNPTPPIPAIAPALAPFVLPANNLPAVSSSGHGISDATLEDSLFRFLTPTPVEPQLNDVARQAGANPITLPTDNPSTAPSVVGGEISPTGVADLIYPSWTDAKDTPSWYARGGDVDDLLEDAEALDWLADTGDLNETYQPQSDGGPPGMPTIPDFDDVDDKVLGLAGPTTSVNTMPHVDSNVEDVVPPLPSLFDGTDTLVDASSKKLDSSCNVVVVGQLGVGEDVDVDDAHLDVFDSPMEEHEFVSTLLESTTGESSISLPALK